MLLFFDIGSSELLLIFLVIVIFFGANKIPELARGLSKGIRQFKDATGSIQREIENSINEQETQKPEKKETIKAQPPSNSVPKTETPGAEQKPDEENKA